MGEVEAGKILAVQKNLHHQLLRKRNAITWPKARDLAAQSLLFLDDADQCWQFATNWLQSAFDAERVDGGRGDPREPIYVPAQAESLTATAPVPSMRPLRIDNRDPGVRALWRSANPIVFADISQEARLQPELRQALITVGTTTKVAVALRSGGRPFGLLCMDRVVTSRLWTGGQYELFQSVVHEVLEPILGAVEKLGQDKPPVKAVSPTVFRSSANVDLLALLTPAECRVARLAATGMSYKEIARQLDRAFSTVDHQLRSIRRKLAVGSHTRLASLLASCQEGAATVDAETNRESSR